MWKNSFLQAPRMACSLLDQLSPNFSPAKQALLKRTADIIFIDIRKILHAPVKCGSES